MTDSSSATILIIDDEKDVVALLYDYVSSMGNYRIFTFLSGRKALEKVERINPDLILLDIMMDDMVGTDVCRALKANEKTAHIPVIAVTVIRKINTLEYNEIMASGIDEYVEKPLDYDGLLKVVNRYLKRG